MFAYFWTITRKFEIIGNRMVQAHNEFDMESDDVSLKNQRLKISS